MAKPNFPTEEYWEPSQTSKMKLFVKTVNGLQPLTNFAKSSILDIWLGIEYATAQSYVFKTLLINVTLQSQNTQCIFSECKSSHRRCFGKKVLLESLSQVFFCEFCKISKNTFLTERLRTTALRPRENLYKSSII